MSGQLRVFLLFTCAYFMSYFYRSANAVIAPSLTAELGLTAAQLGFMTSIFFATFAATQLPLGVMLDRWGPRWVTPGLMLIGVVGSLIFAVAGGFAGLALGRALIGVGMAGVLMGSFKMFSRWFAASRYATVSGLLVGIGSLGALVAATPLAWLNNSFGWRNAFTIGAVITGVIALAIMALTRNTPPEEPWEGTRGGLAGLGTVLQDRRIWRVLPITFFVAGTVLGFQGLWAGPYLFDVQGMDDIAVGNTLLWLGVGATIGYITSGWLCDRFGLLRTTVVAIIGFILCQLALALQPPLALVYPLYFLFGICGAFNVMLLALGRHLFPLSMTGIATTTINLFAIGGVFVLQWAMGLIIGLWIPDIAGHYPPAAHSAALLFTSAGTALALIWFWPLMRMKQEGNPQVS